jgi:hypothetical protein
VAVALGVSTVALGAAASPAAACAGAWARPVDGAIVDPFRAPPNPYGPGNRGIDLAGPAGTPVRAAGDGVVSFAGSVGGTLHVVVAHDGGLRTTYGFLATAAVRARQRVGRGQVVGTTGGGGPGQPAQSLHFGLRLGDRYVDPSVLFGPCDLTKLVHLAPTDQPPAEPWDRLRAGGVASIEVDSGGGGGILDDLTGAVGSLPGAVGGLAGAAWDAGTSAGGAVVRGAARYGSTLLDQLRGAAGVAVRRSPLAPMLEVAAEFGRRFHAWWKQRSNCSEASPPADGTGGSTHLLLAVGGINSRGSPDTPTFSLDAAALGYHDDEVTYFSYARDGGEYRPEDTWKDLMRSARLLDAQLRRSQQQQPGREVDLIAHSQGGVVVDVFLQHVYEASDPGLPPIGTVVTLSSPHQGAPLSTAAQNWGDSAIGGLVDAAGSHLPVPPADAPSVRQLDEDAPFQARLWDGGLPDHIDFTTIGGTDDLLVPATQIGVPGATEVVVNVGGGPFDDHTNIPRDPKALQAVRAALEGRPPPCVGTGDGLRGALMPVLISRVERGLGVFPEVLP